MGGRVLGTGSNRWDKPPENRLGNHCRFNVPPYRQLFETIDLLRSGLGHHRFRGRDQRLAASLLAVMGEGVPGLVLPRRNSGPGISPTQISRHPLLGGSDIANLSLEIPAAGGLL
jgi:hypothetical protein